jgi:hypothetical protein
MRNFEYLPVASGVASDKIGAEITKFAAELMWICAAPFGPCRDSLHTKAMEQAGKNLLQMVTDAIRPMEVVAKILRRLQASPKPIQWLNFANSQ